MRIYLAGATGAIGLPLVKRLILDGHQVFGLTRSKEKAHLIEGWGAFPIIADALNEQAVKQSVQKIQPDVIIDMLTSLPKEYTPKAMREAAEQNYKLHMEGSAILLRAAQEAKVKRYIIQSSCFLYAPGQGPADETAPFAFDEVSGIASITKVYAEIEKRVLQAGNIEGVVLRYGFFYGPGTWFTPEGNMADQVRKQEYSLIGGGHGVWNFVHIEDAADATAEALTAEPGAYNITNDTPVEVAVWLPSFARWLNAPPPPPRSAQEEEHLNGPLRVYYATQLRAASNAKAKSALNFAPRPLEWLTSY